MPDATAELDQHITLCKQLQQEWCQPVFDALVTEDLAAARARLAKAQRALAAAQLPEPVGEVIHCYLDFLELRVDWYPPSDSWNLASFSEAAARFEQPARTDLGNIQRVKCLLTLRYRADTDKLHPLTRAELEAILAQYPGSKEESSLWHDISIWAFEHGELDLVEKAFEVLLINPSPSMGQAKWQRVNLMHLLLTGRAERRDVEQTIATLQILPQLNEFRDRIWPKCVEAGIVDSELEAQLAACAAEIEATMPLPADEPRTRTVKNLV